jgi:cysteine-rich repeat protein
MQRNVLWAVLVPSVVVLSVTSCAAGHGEDADNTTSADTTSPLCGNGVRDDGEQCDDGNVTSLDGCSATCGFEEVQRMNSMKIMFGTDSFCTANALGGAVGSSAQSQLQDNIGQAVTNGTINVLFTTDGLTDLTGQNAPQIQLGSFVGDPSQGATAGLDSWYTVKASSLAPTGFSATQLPGSITNGALSAGPGNLSFALALGGAGGQLDLSSTKARTTIGATSVPTTSSNGSSPGHVPSEHLDPTLKTFGSSSAGQICGNISASSLAAIPAPSQLTSGSTSCSQGYTSANSLLDVFVGGCTIFIVTAFNPTQPDKTTDATVGSGGPYKLVAGSGHKVTSCKDHSGATVDLATCLKSAAYSAGFQFTTQRVIVKGVTQ